MLEDITITVPIKNEAKNIENFLKSIPDRVNADFVFVDSGNDNSSNIIKKYRPHAKIISLECSIPFARQIGVEETKTEWILFSDADVEFRYDYFSKLERKIKDVYSDAIYGIKLSKDYYTQFYYWQAKGQALSEKAGIPAATGSNMLIKKKVFDTIRGFDFNLVCNEDSEIMWRVKNAGFKVNFHNDLIVYATDHRRLEEKGMVPTAIHHISRCTLLYLGILSEEQKKNDWGYWSKKDG